MAYNYEIRKYACISMPETYSLNTNSMRLFNSNCSMFKMCALAHKLKEAKR